MAEIDGGFTITPRKLHTEWLMDKPPLWAKLWLWMTNKACFSDNGSLKRGQLFVSNKIMIEATIYKTGYRVHKHTVDEVRAGYEAFKKQGMITTQRTSRGNVVTIRNYDKIQNISSYLQNKKTGGNKKATKPEHDKQGARGILRAVSS